MDGSVSSVKAAPQAFREAMRRETEQMLDEVLAAVNDAPDGAWINASEMKVRDLLGDYRRRVFERALQMRGNAAEGAFSPDRPGHGQAPNEQRGRAAVHADQQRPGEPVTPALAKPGRGRRDAGRHAAGRGGSDGEPRGA